MERFTIAQWAIYVGITYEEAYEENVDYILADGTVVYLKEEVLV